MAAAIGVTADTAAHDLAAAAAQSLAREWLDDLFPHRQGDWLLRPFGDLKAVADSPRRLIAMDRSGKPHAVLYIAVPSSPGLVLRAAELATAARHFLGREIGAGVLTAARTGWANGLSVALYPWRTDTARGFIRSRLARPRIRVWALAWLRGVAQASAARYPESADPAEVRPVLDRLSTCAVLSDDIRTAIDRAVARLRVGAWRPRWLLDHNDFWPGNIMVNRDQLSRPAGPSPFVIIDWAGANLRGGGFVDLVRAATGFALSPHQLNHEVSAHCELFALTPEDAVSQALLSLGCLYQNLEHFPLESFARLTSRTVDRLGPAHA